MIIITSSEHDRTWCMLFKRWKSWDYVRSYKIIVLLLSTNWWWIVIFNHTFKFIKINLQWVLTLAFKTVLPPTISVYGSNYPFISCADVTLVCNTRSTRQPLYGQTAPSTDRLFYTKNNALLGFMQTFLCNQPQQLYTNYIFIDRTEG